MTRRGRAAAAIGAALSLALPASAAANSLHNVRIGVDGARTRIVFDLSEPADYDAVIDPNDPTALRVRLDHLESGAGAALGAAPQGLVAAIATDDAGVVAFKLVAPARIDAVFALAPSERTPWRRLVVDLVLVDASAPAPPQSTLAGAAALRDAPPTALATQFAAASTPASEAGEAPASPRPRAAARPGVVVSADGLTVAFGDSGVEANLGGRIHADAAFFSKSPTQMSDDVALRRARLAFSLRAGERFRLKIERDFSKLSNGWKNVWASYEIADRVLFKAGNQMPPFSLESLSSSNEAPFMERSLASALAPELLTGVAASVYGRHYSVTGGYFGGALSADSNVNVDKGRSVIARATLAPVNRPGAVVHLGISAERRDLDGDSMSRVRTRPEIVVGARRLIDTGTMTGVGSYYGYGAEFGAQFGALNLQSQLVRRDNNAGALGDPRFVGGYAQLSWALTGEARGYSESAGAFTDIRPTHRLGALEAAARVSMLDISDGAIDGGRETDFTLGLNWYVTDNARLMLNLIRAEARPNRKGVAESVNIAGMRAQIDF